MSLITVSLSTAMLCFASHCYPALVGKATPIGTFPIVLRVTDDAGYGGDVLKFKETDDTVYAVHRVWTLNPKEHRIDRLKSNANNRKNITNGCINVMPEVYDIIKDADEIQINP